MTLWPFTKLVWVPSAPGAQVVNLTLGQGVTNNGIVVQPGVKGFDAPIFQHSHTETPGIDGGHYNATRVPPREIFIPVYIEGADRGQFLQRKRAFLSAISPLGSLTPGRLYITEGDGSTRTIDLHYFDGAEGDENVDAAGFHWCKYGLRFVAMDPYFYASSTVTRTWTGDVEDMLPFFGSPFFGLALNRTLSFNGEVTLDTVGDVDSWPVWIIEGPIQSATFINHSLNQTFELIYQIEEGEIVTIDTRPGKKTVRSETGLNLWEFLGPNPQMWPVGPQSNQVEIFVNGVTNNTSVTISYLPRYLSA